MKEALFELVKTKTAITDLIGTGDDCRFYSISLPQGMNTWPAATFRTVDIQDTSDFDGPSTYDWAFIDIHCFGETDDAAESLWKTFRASLVGESGTYSGIILNTIKYMPSGQDDFLDRQQAYTKQLELKIGYIRN